MLVLYHLEAASLSLLPPAARAVPAHPRTYTGERCSSSMADTTRSSSSSPSLVSAPTASTPPHPRLHLPRSSSSSFTQRGRIARSVSAKSNLSLAATSVPSFPSVNPEFEAAQSSIDAGSRSISGSRSRKGKERQIDAESINSTPGSSTTKDYDRTVKSRDYATFRSEDAGSEGSAGSESGGEDNEEDAEVVARPSETDLDPRTMLRQQLQRSESVRAAHQLSRPRSRAPSYRSGLSIPRSATQARGLSQSSHASFDTADADKHYPHRRYQRAQG